MPEFCCKGFRKALRIDKCAVKHFWLTLLPKKEVSYFFYNYPHFLIQEMQFADPIFKQVSIIFAFVRILGWASDTLH
jgi:hypothetical protein